MNETLILAPPLAAGLVLGAFFFGGLWWTVRKGVSSKQPALWFFGSMLLRMSIALAGFYFVGGGHWERLAAVSPRICPGAPRREVADPPAGRDTKPPGTGGQPCALVPIR